MEQRRYEEAVLRMSERQTVRNFSDEHIPNEILTHILEAGINVASGGNLQPYSVIVERDREKTWRYIKVFICWKSRCKSFVFDGLA